MSKATVKHTKLADSHCVEIQHSGCQPSIFTMRGLYRPMVKLVQGVAFKGDWELARKELQATKS